MKGKVILLFVILLGLSWYTAFSESVNNPKKVQEHLKNAEELEKKEIFVDAVAEYEKALEIKPEQPEIYVKLANAYLNSNNVQKFKSVCEQTAETYPENREALDTLIKYYEKNNDEYDAVKYLQEFLKDYPDNKAAQDWFIKLKGSYEEIYSLYGEIKYFSNDVIVFEEEGAYGIADATGRELIKAEFKELHPFSAEGFALASREKRTYVYIDEAGQTRKVPDKEYKNLGMFESGCVVACKGEKYGFLDDEMKPSSEFEWDKLTGIKNNIGAGKKGEKWVLINSKGKMKSKEKYGDVICDENGFCSAQKCIFVKKGESYILVDGKGKQKGKLKFEDAKAFSEEGCAAIRMEGKWGYTDSEGKLAVKCQYEDAESFHNGFAAVKLNGKWGYIDEEGNLVIKPEFAEVTGISKNGTAAVKLGADDDTDWKLIQLNIFL